MFLNSNRPQIETTEIRVQKIIQRLHSYVFESTVTELLNVVSHLEGLRHGSTFTLCHALVKIGILP